MCGLPFAGRGYDQAKILVSEMVKKFTIAALVLLLSRVGFTQDGKAVPITLHTAQQVVVVGEDVWVDGNIGPNGSTARIVALRLLDRKGSVKAEVRLPQENGRFQGYLELPQDLVSDYYFIDGYIKGFATEVPLLPLMVINPKLPPVRSCNEPAAPNASDATATGGAFSTDKDTYGVREKATLTFKEPSGKSPVMVYVSRTDVLTDLLETAAASFRMVQTHPSMGDKESEGHVLKVRVRSVPEGQSVKGVRVIAAIMGSQATLGSGVTDEKGVATILLPFVYGERSVVLSAEPQAGKTWRLEWEDETVAADPIVFPCLRLDESMRDAIEARLFNSRMSREYHANDIRQFQFEDRDTTDFYGKPDKRYLLDEYVRFPNMQEILEEFVPEVRVRGAKDPEPVLQVLNLPEKSFFNSNGLILLDGIPVRRTRDLMDMNPLLLESIDVMNRKYLLGDWELNGVLQYRSYKHDLAGFSLPADHIIYTFKGIQEKALPAAIEHSPADRRLPDFSNLLYRDLNAALQNGGTLHFFTSDAVGDYRIRVIYTDPGGREVEARRTIKVE